ncbi:MAG TPA: hypothetical protein VGP72_23830 [Planctomycetota bacterium]|jgi:hypothetical protein
MSDLPKKRRWFQFHLSTAIVLMVVSGALLWLNMPDREYDFSLSTRTGFKEAGWPFAAVFRETHQAHISDPKYKARCEEADCDLIFVEEDWHIPKKWLAVADVVICAAIVCSVGFALQRLSLPRAE